MGISAIVLFEKDHSIDIEKLLITTEDWSIRENLYFKIGNSSIKEQIFDSLNKLKYARVYLDMKKNYVNHDYTTQLCVGFYDEPYENKIINFRWYSEKKFFFKAIVVEEFFENEKLLFEFLYIILKTFPQGLVWIEENWFYRSEDLEKIKNNPFDEDWCYKNPKEL